jgi:pimeloyl-ACP methyl ester carboxylesterase
MFPFYASAEQSVPKFPLWDIIYYLKQNRKNYREWIVRVLFLIWISIAFSADLFAGVPGRRPFPESRFTMIDSVKIHFRNFPARTSVSRGSVLLVHGFAGSTFSWRFVADTLAAAGYHVVAVDVPPFGYSDKSPVINQSFTARAQMLNKFMNLTYPGKLWHLVGHSMGGGMVQAFTQLSVGEYDTPWLLRGSVRREVALFVTRPVLVNRFSVKRLLKDAYGQVPDDDAVRGYLTPMRIKGTSRAILAAPNVSSELFPLRADSISVPAMAIWGDQDTWVPATAYEHAIEMMGDMRFIMIHGAAHCPMETHADEFIQYLLRFLSDVPDRPASQQKI